MNPLHVDSVPEQKHVKTDTKESEPKKKFTTVRFSSQLFEFEKIGAFLYTKAIFSVSSYSNLNLM